MPERVFKFSKRKDGFKVLRKHMQTIAREHGGVPREAVQDGVWLIVGLVKQLLNRAVQRRSGRLVNSINGKVFKVKDKHYEGKVGSYMDYALAVEFGTKPHDIFPRFKKALSFPGRNARSIKTHKRIGSKRGMLTRNWKQKYVYYETYKHVHHPGTKAHFVFGDALIISLPTIIENTLRILKLKSPKP